jgi:hypothetical protein
VSRGPSGRTREHAAGARRPRRVGLPRPESSPALRASLSVDAFSELPSKTAFAKEIDFHQIVAAMNQYPALLRRLGLVVDFAIEASAFAAAPDALLTVSVALPAPAAAVKRLEDASPRTRALLTPSRFEPLPRPTPEPGDFLAANGLLKVDPHQFRLVQTDVDGAGLKVTNFARSSRSSAGRASDSTPRRSSSARWARLRSGTRG